MKKTLTIMMTAATALFGLSSCSDSNNNNSSSPAAPISVKDFASGAKYYEMSANGATYTLSVTPSDAAQQPEGTSSAAVTLSFSSSGTTAGAGTATYTVDGGQATLTINAWTSVTSADTIATAWGLAAAPTEGTEVEALEGTDLQGVTFTVTISGGAAIFSSELGSNTSVVYAKEGVETQNYSVTVKKNEASDPTPDGEEQEDGVDADLKPAA